MYTNNNKGSRINWVDIVVRIIFAALFILILVWLFPKVPNMTPFYSNVFRENIKYMQEAGKGYFTTERLPKTEGETKELALSEMFEKKLILDFVDKEGNSCNQFKSSVSVTKESTQYVMRVKLVCNDEEDYVVEVMGCYDYCENKNTNTNNNCNTSNSVIEYQYKKAIKKNVTSYSCPSGYSLSGKNCYKNITSSKIDAKKEYYNDETKVYDADVKGGGTGTTTTSPIVNQTGTSYSCPSGYTKNGTKCEYIINASYSASCPSGTYYSTNGTCVRTVSAGESSKVCPSGYSPDGSQCSKYEGSAILDTKPADKNTTSESCDIKVYYEPKSGSNYKLIESYLEPYCTSSGCSGTRVAFRYRVCSGGSTTYSCAKYSGYTLSGTNCVKTGSKKVYANYITGSGSCPSGYILSNNNTCFREESPGSGYSCPSNYVQEGSKCVYRIDATKQTGYSYSCPSGYTQYGSGSSITCSKSVTNPSNLYCKDPNAKLVVNKCHIEIKGGFKGYSCPSGYKLNGYYCYKTSTDKIKAKSNSSTKTVYDYKWSEKASLSGWSRTGKTRTKTTGSKSVKGCLNNPTFNNSTVNINC